MNLAWALTALGSLGTFAAIGAVLRLGVIRMDERRSERRSSS